MSISYTWNEQNIDMSPILGEITIKQTAAAVNVDC